MTAHPARLNTRQLRVLQAVADDNVTHDRLYGDLAPFQLDGHSVSWTITELAVLGLVAFDPLLPSPAHLTPRGITTLDASTHLGTTHTREGGHA